MNHIYQRYLKLSTGLVAEARESWQQHPDPECREILFQRYLELQNEMEHYDYILHGRQMQSSNKTTVITSADTFNFRKDKPINLTALLRHSTDGVWVA